MDNIEIEVLEKDNHKRIYFNNIELIIFKKGKILKENNSGLWKENNVINQDGYNTIKINGKMYLNHYILAHVFLNMDINNTSKEVNHIDGIKTNDNIQNLRVRSCVSQ
jgi:hypothetical protein